MCSLVLPVSHVGLRSLSRTFVQREFCSDCTASRVIHLKPLLVARCFLPYYFAEFVASRYYPCLFPSTHAPTLIYEPVLYCALGAEISDHLWIMRLLQVWRRACLQSTSPSRSARLLLPNSLAGAPHLLRSHHVLVSYGPQIG